MLSARSITLKVQNDNSAFRNQRRAVNCDVFSLCSADRFFFRASAPVFFSSSSSFSNVSDDFIAIVKKEKEEKRREIGGRSTARFSSLNTFFFCFFFYYFYLILFFSPVYIFTTESLLCWGSLHLAWIKGKTNGHSLASDAINGSLHPPSILPHRVASAIGREMHVLTTQTVQQTVLHNNWCISAPLARDSTICTHTYLLNNSVLSLSFDSIHLRESVCLSLLSVLALLNDLSLNIVMAANVISHAT